MKEPIVIKVRLHHVDIGFCKEVWQTERQTQGQHLYLGRSTESEKQWYILADAPDGYCEFDKLVGKHVELTICDRKWNEVFRDGNDREKFPEPFEVTKELQEGDLL